MDKSTTATNAERVARRRPGTGRAVSTAATAKKGNISAKKPPAKKRKRTPSPSPEPFDDNEDDDDDDDSDDGARSIESDDDNEYGFSTARVKSPLERTVRLRNVNVLPQKIFLINIDFILSSSQ